MIYGIGIDIVEIKRIKYFDFKGSLDSLIRRVLTAEEVKQLPKTKSAKLSFIAKRYAAKEALSKALGVGIGKKFSFQNVLIMNDENGKPLLKAEGKLEDWLNTNHCNLFLSLTDEKKYAVAMVLIEKNLIQ